MEVRFIAEFKSIDRISPLVWELEHIVGKDKAHTLVQTPCKLMVESWVNSGLSRETESQRVLLVFDVEPNKAYRLHQCGVSYGGDKEHFKIKCLYEMRDIAKFQMKMHHAVREDLLRYFQSNIMTAEEYAG